MRKKVTLEFSIEVDVDHVASVLRRAYAEERNITPLDREALDFVKVVKE